MAWQRFTVELEGHDEPLVVQTSARDWAGVQVDPGAPKALDMTFRVVHAALLRTGAANVPASYDGFLDVLAGVPETDDEAPALNPTVATPSGGSP